MTSKHFNGKFLSWQHKSNVSKMLKFQSDTVLMASTVLLSDCVLNDWTPFCCSDYCITNEVQGVIFKIASEWKPGGDYYLILFLRLCVLQGKTCRQNVKLL